MTKLTKIQILIFVIMTVTTSLFVFSGKTIEPVHACQTNAIGCQEQGGPGASGISPPEVSGCHTSAGSTGGCAQQSTPPGMGLGPRR